MIAGSTLAELAEGAVGSMSQLASEAGGHNVMAAIDARMGEVYVGTFYHRAGDVVALMPEDVAKPEDVAVPEGSGWIAVGTGFAAADGALCLRFADQLARVDAQALPRAGHLARLAEAAFARGEALAPERVEPAYLRNNVALTLAEQQRLRAG